jgi:hypothetical protein
VLYANITAPVGITFAVQMKGFMCLHIGEKYALYASRIFRKTKGACPILPEECVYFYWLDLAGWFCNNCGMII